MRKLHKLDVSPTLFQLPNETYLSSRICYILTNCNLPKSPCKGPQKGGFWVPISPLVHELIGIDLMEYGAIGQGHHHHHWELVVLQEVAGYLAVLRLMRIFFKFLKKKIRSFRVLYLLQVVFHIKMNINL